MKTLRHIPLCVDKHPHFALAASNWRDWTFKRMLYTTFHELSKTEADQAPLFSLNNAYALPFWVQHLFSFEKWSQFLWMLATLTGGIRANLCSDPKLLSTAATTAEQNEMGCIRDLFSPARKKCSKTFWRENYTFFYYYYYYFTLVAYILHKCSVSNLRTMSCLERYVLPSPVCPSSGTQICCPCTASCADSHAHRPTAYSPFALWHYMGNGASYHLPLETGISPREHMNDFWTKALRLPGLYNWLLQKIPERIWIYCSTSAFPNS